MHPLVLQRLEAAVQAGVVKSAAGGGALSARPRARVASPPRVGLLGKGLVLPSPACHSDKRLQSSMTLGEESMTSISVCLRGDEHVELPETHTCVIFTTLFNSYDGVAGQAPANSSLSRSMAKKSLSRAMKLHRGQCWLSSFAKGV